MEKIAEQAIDLLDRLETDPTVVRFMASMEEYGLIFDEMLGLRPGSSLNRFIVPGLGLIFTSNDKRLFTVEFLIEGGEYDGSDRVVIQPYIADLPFGLNKLLNRAKVISNLGCSPYQSNPDIDSFKINELTVNCIFKGDHLAGLRVSDLRLGQHKPF